MKKFFETPVEWLAMFTKTYFRILTTPSTWVIMLVGFLILTSLTGCTTVTTPYRVQGTITNTTDKTTPDKIITSEEYKLTQEAAKLKVKLAKLEAKVEIAKAEAAADIEKAKAEAANPCAMNWFLRPAYCSGLVPVYNGGVYYTGGVVVNGRGGYNYVSRSR